MTFGNTFRGKQIGHVDILDLIPTSPTGRQAIPGSRFLFFITRQYYYY
jgi:hypothetical protein